MEGKAGEACRKFTFAQVDNAGLRRLESAEQALDRERERLDQANKAGDKSQARSIVEDLKRIYAEVEEAKKCCCGLFDQGGALFHIATGGGQKEYQNPHESGEVRVSKSSAGAGKVQDVVASPSGPAGVCSTGGDIGEWIELDLGPGRRLIPDHYCLRNDNVFGTGKYALRNWELQAARQGQVMPAPAIAPVKVRVGRHVHCCKALPTKEDFRRFQRDAEHGRNWHAHTAEQLAEDIFNINSAVRSEREETPLQRLRACTREEILDQCSKHRVELFWQNCISRELDEPFWTTLRKHENDESLAARSWSVAHWPIDRSSEVGYRYFRIKSTGPNAAGGNFRVACAGIELYGTLFEVTEGIPPAGDHTRFSAGAAMSKYHAVAAVAKVAAGVAESATPMSTK